MSKENDPHLLDDPEDVDAGMYLSLLADEPGEGRAAMLLNSLVDDPDELNQDAEQMIEAAEETRH